MFLKCEGSFTFLKPVISWRQRLLPDLFRLNSMQQANRAILSCHINPAIVLSHRCFTLRCSRLNEFFNSRQTQSDVKSNSTTTVESPQCELRPRLTNRLSSNNTHRSARVNQFFRSHGLAITILTYPAW